MSLSCKNSNRFILKISTTEVIKMFTGIQIFQFIILVGWFKIGYYVKALCAEKLYAENII